MSKLYFRLGEAEGFTSKRLSDSKQGYSNPIRELLQNSLDASKDSKNQKCKIDIYIESIDKNDIPHIIDYQNILENAIEYHKKQGSYTSNSEQIVRSIRDTLKEEIKILMFVDNGIGISPDRLNDLIGERSVKPNESSGGSYGIGHLSSYFLSYLRYVLYAGKYYDNGYIKKLFSGSPILAGYEDEESSRGSIGRILEKEPESERKPKYIFPEDFPDFIKPKMENIDTGSMVVILGLNQNWDREANYAIVSNFFYAIHNRELTVQIHHGDILINIDERDIDRMLEKQKDGKIAQGDKILSDWSVYQSWLSIKDDKYKNYIHLDNGDKVCAHIRNAIDGDSVIALVRNGMLIARHDKMLSNDLNNLRKDENFESFSAVINVDEKECPELFQLVRGAESPYHNQLERNRLKPEEKERKLKILFKELSENIKEYLMKKDRENFNLLIPLLEIPDKAEIRGTNTNRPRSQTPKAKPKNEKVEPPPTGTKTTGEGTKRKAPNIPTRRLDAESVARMRDNGKTIDIALNIKPKKMSDRDEVYLSMSLEMDTDDDSTSSALDFLNLSLDGEKIEIKDRPDKNYIKLGKLSASQTYQIQATLKKPNKLKNIGVAVKPFLGLKQSKKDV